MGNSKRLQGFAEIRYWKIGKVLIYLCIVAFVIIEGTGLYSARMQVNDFESKTSDSIILGKSRQEVISVLGAPDWRGNWSPAVTVFIYNGPMRTAAIIKFQDDRAFEVERRPK